MSETVQIKTPWLASKDPEVPSTLNYSTLSMCGRVEEMVRQYPNYIAYEFMGKTTTYAEMWQKINACAKSLKAIGIREGDKVTICMPNAPQTLCMFYAVNMVGAIANMVHPLSAESEISFYLRDSNSVAAITLDQFYPKFESVRKTVDLPCLIVTSVADELKPLLRVGYQLTEGRKNPKVPRGPGVVLWKDFLKRGEHVEIYRIKRKDTDPAAILYSGGTTECVTASCLTPIHKQKEGSIGIPFPDTYYKIVKPGTQEEVPYGEEGEICLSGPTVMLEYVNHPEETAQTKQTHADGLTWIHTGDLGMMDEEGFIYFRQRIKRMIVTNGYNVYPSQLENILDGHDYVHLSCVICVKDPIKMQRVKAFVVLKPGYQPTEACKKELLDYCRKHIAKYAMPSDIEFREELPKTLVGKVAYRVLEEEENAKQAQKAVEDAKRAEEDAKRAEAEKAEKLSAAKKPAAKKPAPKKPAHPTAKPEPAKQAQKANTPHDGQNNDIKE